MGYIVYIKQTPYQSETESNEMDYIINTSRKYGVTSVTCKACRKARTIDTRVVLTDETAEDAYAAHKRSTYHQSPLPLRPAY